MLCVLLVSVFLQGLPDISQQGLISYKHCGNCTMLMLWKVYGNEGEKRTSQKIWIKRLCQRTTDTDNCWYTAHQDVERQISMTAFWSKWVTFNMNPCNDLHLVDWMVASCLAWQNCVWTEPPTHMYLVTCVGFCTWKLLDTSSELWLAIPRGRSWSVQVLYQMFAPEIHRCVQGR